MEMLSCYWLYCNLFSWAGTGAGAVVEPTFLDFRNQIGLS